jgi:RNA polymerase sigma factor (sigma-70 family)
MLHRAREVRGRDLRTLLSVRDEDPDGDAVRFTALWEEHADRVLAYARRHVPPEDAQEIVAETFLVAWRRLADVPGTALPWLLVVARNTISNHRRSGYRHALIDGELARLEVVAASTVAAEVTASERAAALTRLAALSVPEREALLLVAWDGLTPSQAAQVAGCSVSAFHVRLFRARRRLKAGEDAETSEVHASPPLALRPQPTASRSTR